MATQGFRNLLGLLFIVAATGSGFALGSSLAGELGGLVGIAAGAVWGFRLAADCAELLEENRRTTGIVDEGRFVALSKASQSHPADSRRGSLQRRPKSPGALGSNSAAGREPGLEEIHLAFKRINSHIWRELRVGALAGCHALLYAVRLEEGGDVLDWREVNRRLVSSLHGFETAATDNERYRRLVEALDRIGQKHEIVKEVAALKGDSIQEERAELERTEAELWRLSRLLRSWSRRLGKP
jgi:hypothetical protein